MSDMDNGQPLPDAGPDTPPSDQPTGEGKVFAADYVQALRKEAQTYRQRLRESEGKMAELEQVREAMAQLQAERRMERLHAAVEREAARLGIVDAEAALKLLDEVQFDDAGKPQGVDTALRALVQKRPYLVVNAQASPTNPPRGESTRLTLDGIRSMTPAELNARWDEVQAVLSQPKP